MFGSQSSAKQRIAISGFGLIELLVSISIMVLVMGVVLTRQDSFNSATLLRSQAFDLALSAREMQLMAVSADARGGTNFRNTYGLHFNITSRNSFIIFQDQDGDSFFDSGEAVGQQGVIDPRFRIYEINYITNSGSSPVTGPLSVVFKRPNFDALFYTGSNSPQNYDAIEIIITPRGVSTPQRKVNISRTGQISVE